MKKETPIAQPGIVEVRRRAQRNPKPQAQVAPGGLSAFAHTWEVIEDDYLATAAQTDIRHKRMYVASVANLRGYLPAWTDEELSDLQHQIIGHELMHVLISAVEPPELPGVHPIAIQIAEDLRVDFALAAIGERIDLLSRMRLELNADQPEDTDHQKRLNAAMRMEAHISRAIDWSMAGPVVHDAILTNGRYGIGRMVRVRCYPQLRMKTGRAAMEETAKQITEWYFTDPVKKLATANEQPDIKDLPGQTKWFDMTIQELPLTVPTERASSPRSSTSGFVVRQVARLFSDGKIFQSSKRDIKPRDGYLVDCSGSMGWELTELIRVLTEKSPKGTVAIYGHDGSMVLTVIAKNGRRATDEALNALGIGESNRIDGPALAWLGQQPKLGHRYWISDGQAGGKSGCTYQAQVDAEAICSMYRIKRIESK